MDSLIVCIPCTFVLPRSEPFQGEMILSWHPEIPPLVRMDLCALGHEDVQWSISRDTLIDCMIGDKGRVYGEGDFQIERGDVSGHIVVRSHVPDGEGGLWTHRCGLTFFVEPLLRFVRDTTMLVPRGKSENEPMQHLLDQWLETL